MSFTSLQLVGAYYFFRLLSGFQILNVEEQNMAFVSESPELEVPDRIRGTFRRMLSKSPHDIREDPEYQRRLLTFLKLGNESAARQFIAIGKAHLIEQLSLIKRHARDVVESEVNGENGGDDENQAVGELKASQIQIAEDLLEGGDSDESEDAGDLPEDANQAQTPDSQDSSVNISNGASSEGTTKDEPSSATDPPSAQP
jgi:hypothetical protein